MTSGTQHNASTYLHLFGMPCLKDANRHTLSVRGRKSIALIGYLALTSSMSHSRERLAGLFWPALNDKDARNNLRVSISRIAKLAASSEPPLLLTSRLTVAFNPRSSLSCDVYQFNQLLQFSADHDHGDQLSCAKCYEQLNRAAALYSADFMEGFHLDECEEFEQWQTSMREELRASAVSTLSVLGQRCEAVGDFAEAERFSRSLLKLAPYNEEAHRRLMTALVQRGDRTGASEYYSLLETKLRKELGVVPDKVTQTLATSIKNGDFESTFNTLSCTEHYSNSVKNPHNLPVEKSPYIGNGKFLEKLSDYLEQQRLITLTGIGGVGKTRIAVQVCRSLLPQYPGGIWLVQLASLNSRTEMLSKLASVLGAQLLPGDDAISSIGSQLDNRKRLLILDNFEHLLVARDVVTSLLEQTRNMSILITSRQRLQLTEEAVFPVIGLSYIGSESFGQSTETEDDASELFIDVASRRRLDFKPDTSNKTAIRRIVSLVKGHPLAIVLAASWVDGLSCSQIISELESGLGILETETGDVPERQRSVRATFNYSWALLEDEEQRLFCALSVFRGGFDGAAAQAVSGASLLTLTRLVRKSLLQHLPENERYEMHELMRQYAKEKLDTLGLRTKIEKGHSDYFLSILNDISSSKFDDNAVLQQQRFSTDFNNIRKAWHFALHDENQDVLIRAIVGLRVMCSLGAHSHDLLELLKPAMPLIENPTEDLSQRKFVLNLLLAMGFAYRYTDGYFAKELGDIFARAYALTDDLETSPELFVVLYGKWSFNFTSGFLANNEPVLIQWRERLSSLDSEAKLLPYAKDAEFVRHMLEGPQLQGMGELTMAREIIQAGLVLEDSDRYAAMMGNYGLNFAVSGRHWLAINQCIAGLLEQSAITIFQAHEIAEQGKNPYLRMFVTFGKLVIATLRMDVAKINLHATAVDSLVSKHRIFQAFQHHASIYSAYAKLSGGSSVGLQSMQSLIDSGRGIPIFCLFDVQLFADSLVRAGKPNEAIKYLHTYTGPAKKRKIGFSLAESSRIEGDAYFAMGDHAKAQLCYRKALSVGQRQEAGLYKLRAAVALAKLLVANKKDVEARQLLLPIIGSLPECSDSTDYSEAVTVIKMTNGT